MLRLMLQSGLYYKKVFKTQNPRLIKKSGFKSRAAYDGALMVMVYVAAKSIRVVAMNMERQRYFYDNRGFILSL